MKSFLACLGAVAILALGGCLTSSGPVWLHAGDVKMKDYERARVLVLPAEIAPSYEMTDNDLRLTQGLVAENLKDVFDLKKVDTLTQLDFPHVYPYSLDEARDIARLYRAAAAVTLSVEAVQLNEQGMVVRRSLRIRFIDVEDPQKSWSISRKYGADSGFDADSKRFNLAMRADFLSVKQRLGVGKGFFGALSPVKSSDNRGPTLTVESTYDFSEEGPAIKKSAHAVTELTEIPLVLIAEDPSGLKATEIKNDHADFQFRIVHTPDNAAIGEAPQTVTEKVIVPLKRGENLIEITTTSGQGSTTKRIAVTSNPAQALYALGVGIRDYAKFPDKDGAAIPEIWHDKLNQSADPAGNSFMYLPNQMATQSAIVEKIYDIGAKAAENVEGLSVFYFAGRVEARKAGIFLVAYDSDPKLVEVTGVDTSRLASIALPNYMIILDLCEQNRDIQRQLLDTLPKAAIAFDSCNPGGDTLANRIEAKRKTSKSLREAIELVVEEHRKARS